jgi:hypothetical protein
MQLVTEPGGWASGMEQDRELSLLIARETVAGAGLMLAEAGADATALRKAVTSPNGTTERAIATFDARGLPSITALMFAGRVGTVTLAAALALRQRSQLYHYPEERPIIG